MSAPFYAVFGLFIALGGLAWFCDWWTKKHPRNRYVKRKGRIPGKPWNDPRSSISEFNRIIGRN